MLPSRPRAAARCACAISVSATSYRASAERAQAKLSFNSAAAAAASLAVSGLGLVSRLAPGLGAPAVQLQSFLPPTLEIGVRSQVVEDLGHPRQVSELLVDGERQVAVAKALRPSQLRVEEVEDPVRVG